ncbi:hypothetical protein JHL22_10990 [Advenella sp. WQ 585]|uniref:Peptide O-xylosyltransferase n=1 Tax=Advenella mandrilli TaxID=2800330 RepID=A0ABS1EES1_9BURK|nr:beta-1,6-N-acetylglucosaminyltransferase [Advenella mandrilli]MBK1781743.1 hypothetical protein [Advenella mandrilli]
MFIYAIQCHKLTNPLIFTINYLLKDPNNIIIIHVDAKTNHTDFLNIKNIFQKNDQLIFIEDRVEVFWGSFSQIEATLKLMRKAISYKFKYFSLISGDDIPILKTSEMNKFLSESYEKKIEFIGINTNNDAPNRIQFKYPKYFHNKDHSLKAKILRKIFIKYANIFNKIDISELPSLYKGSSWFTISYEAIDYIFNYLEKNKQYKKKFLHSLCADEVFFQTILFNSNFKNKTYGLGILKDCDMAMRYIDWEKGPDFPRSLDKSDFTSIKTSGMLFARKISSNISLKELEENFI